ncbi:MAG: hypothetical protein RR209_05470, partial [Angelakisella sp.]
TSKSMPPVNYYGAVLNNPDGTLCGEGNIDPVDGLHNMTETKSDCDFSADYSMSLNITPQLAARLKKGGLIPAKTKAYCLDGELGMCTYFDDGVTQLIHLRGSSNIAEKGQMEVGTIYDADIFAEKYAAGYALYEKENREHLQYAFSWSPSDYTYHGISIRNAQPIFGELLAYKPVKGAKQEENPVELLGFLSVMGDNSKHSFYLTETQLYSKEEGVLDATPAQCKVLHEFAKSCNADTRMITRPQWLAYLTPARVTEFEFSGSLPDSSQKDISFSTCDNKNLISGIARQIRSYQVVPGSGKRNDGKPNPDSPAGLMTMKLTFDSGVVYDIRINGNSLDVMSSDM